MITEGGDTEFFFFFHFKASLSFACHQLKFLTVGLTFPSLTTDFFLRSANKSDSVNPEHEEKCKPCAF